jgi:hypothetical protein
MQIAPLWKCKELIYAETLIKYIGQKWYQMQFTYVIGIQQEYYCLSYSKKGGTENDFALHTCVCLDACIYNGI